MPKAYPLIQIAKKLASVQAKSAKINEEIKALAEVVATELKKVEATPATAKVAPAKAVPAKVAPKVVASKEAPAKVDKTVVAPKRGSPAKK